MTSTKAFDGRVIQAALSEPAANTGAVAIGHLADRVAPVAGSLPLETVKADSREWVSVSDQYSDESQRTSEPGPLNAGDRFLKYHIVREIGAGGYARVYQAFDTFVKREVALKIIHRPRSDQKELFLRTSAEAQFLLSVKHSYLVDVYEAGFDNNNVLYIAMELLRGKPLRSLIESAGRLEWEQFVPIAAMIAEGLQVVHENRAIHRDLKPENIFVLKDGTPKILDFGIAKFIDSPAVVTQKNIFHGTPPYMAPEQLLGKPASPHSDMYSLGIVFWEVLAGKNPFQLEPCNTTEALAWRHLHFHPPLVSEFTQTVPRRIAKVINKMMAKPPAQRPQSMKELAADLRRNYEKCISANPGLVSTHSTGGIAPLSPEIVATICRDEQPRLPANVERLVPQHNVPTQPRMPVRASEASISRAQPIQPKAPVVAPKPRRTIHPRTWTGTVVLALASGAVVFAAIVAGYKTTQFVTRFIQAGRVPDEVVIDVTSEKSAVESKTIRADVSPSIVASAAPIALTPSKPPAPSRNFPVAPKETLTPSKPPAPTGRSVPTTSKLTNGKRLSAKGIDTETPLIMD